MVPAIKVQLDHGQLRSFDDKTGRVISTNAAVAWPVAGDSSIEGPGITVLLVRDDDVSTELVISEAQLVELGYIPALAPLEEEDPLEFISSYTLDDEGLDEIFDEDEEGPAFIFCPTSREMVTLGACGNNFRHQVYCKSLGKFVDQDMHTWSKSGELMQCTDTTGTVLHPEAE